MRDYAILSACMVLIFLLCVCVGSVSLPPGDIAEALHSALTGAPLPRSVTSPILLMVRLPRVICVALIGAALALCGATMQGLLRNPLADGMTLGVSSGASLGAILSIAFGIQIPGFAGGSVVVMAMLFAFLSLLAILALSYRLDYSLSTHTIILIGVIYTMFTSALISLIATFAGEKARPILFWTMGSLAGSDYANVRTMIAVLAICAPLLLLHARELNAFAIGEDNARHVGIDVKRTKLLLLIGVAALIGVSVSIGGTIGFVGLIIPHIARMVCGPNHRRLLPASIFAGASFLMLADLLSRVILSPRELPIGVVTSLVGAIVFVYIFSATRQGKAY